MIFDNLTPIEVNTAFSPQNERRRNARKDEDISSLRVCGLFAGIGGIEEGFRRAGHRTTALCESDIAARRVLAKRFTGVEIVNDVRSLEELPGCDVITAGFPCQDLSQVGRCAGIDGAESGLVSHVFDLLEFGRSAPRWLLLENVPFMLRLDRGRAVRTIVDRLELMGWSWAYRTIDAHAFGIPQRRRRVLLLASRLHDPRPVLLGEDWGPPPERKRGNHACGFYWTEGNSGIGWGVNAVPPLKGGSGVGIPSPPAIWFPRRRLVGTPSISDAERLQGFEVGWTEPARAEPRGERQRWQLVGNAVSVRVSEWIARRLVDTKVTYEHRSDSELVDGARWPDAAWGRNGERCVSTVSDWPVQEEIHHLSAFLQYDVVPLSHRAAAGFLNRLKRSGLRHDSKFKDDLVHHVATSG